MAYKRILTIQDISCIGQCSMTVAMPILSACGHETCILPTALLSTHTGGFGPPAVLHLESILEDICSHWKQNHIFFDAILIGYLGSIAAVNTAKKIIQEMLAPEGVVIIDPAMADHGKLYSGFAPGYPEAMADLCRYADILLPNLTEAAMLAGLDYQPDYDCDYVNQLLDRLDQPCVILTGVGYGPGETGAIIREGERRWRYSQQQVGASFHGTGDIFAAAFTGALMQGKTKQEAMVIAADFTKMAIEATVKAPAHWYGVKFEPVLPELMNMLGHS